MSDYTQTDLHQERGGKGAVNVQCFYKIGSKGMGEEKGVEGPGEDS